MKLRRTLWILPFIALALLAPFSAQAQTKSTLKWERCSADLPAELECTQVQVPLDYAIPWGDTISIGLNRLKATDPASRIGSLIFEPGGPGGAGTVEVGVEAKVGNIFSPRLRKYYDIIGFDPRGVGTSTPVKCDPAIRNQEPSLLPRTQADYDKLVAYTTAFGASCLKLTGPLLGHLDTESVVRDIDRVREALGEDKLSYLGLSYGTMVGAEYAELFPNRVRTMALDGALDHSQSETSFHLTELQTTEDAMRRFSVWCSETPTCALHDKDVLAEYDALVKKAHQTPLPAKLCADSKACRPTVTGDDILLTAPLYLVFKEPIPELGYVGWADLATYLKEAMDGDASHFSKPIVSGETYVGFAGDAIGCVDFPAQLNQNFDSMYARMIADRALAPHTQGANQSWGVQTKCLRWSVPIQNPPRPLRVNGAPTILIINATHDPSTSIGWALEMKAQIPSSVLLVRDGDGHTSYLNRGASQTRDAIDEYLITGETPPPNTVLPN